MKFLARWIISAISIYIIAGLSIGVTASSFKATLVAACNWQVFLEKFWQIIFHRNFQISPHIASVIHRIITILS